MSNKRYKLKYRIIETYPEERLCVVRYLCDFISEHDLKSDPNVDENGIPVRCRTDVSIEIPLHLGSNIPKEELEAIIWANAPRHFFDKQYELKNNPDGVKIELPLGEEKELDIVQVDIVLQKAGQERAKREALDALELTDEEWAALIGSE